MDQLEKNLIENLGFSGKKAKVYISLLELGETVAVEVAKKARLKRTTVYNLLPELLTDGYVKSTIVHGKKHFFIDDTTQLTKRLTEKLNSVETILPQLKAIHNVHLYKPKISLYEGFGGMKDIYSDIIRSSHAGDIVLTFFGTTNIESLIPKEIVDYYIQERVKKKVRNNIIAQRSMLTEQWQQAEHELREVKILNTPDVIRFDADMKIYSNKVAFISYKENFLGIVIESREVYHLLKLWFETTWNLL